jgi:hypothetical protein
MVPAGGAPAPSAAASAQAGTRSLLQAAPAPGSGAGATQWVVQIQPSQGSAPYVQSQVAQLATQPASDLAQLLRSKGAAAANSGPGHSAAVAHCPTMQSNTGMKRIAGLLMMHKSFVEECLTPVMGGLAHCMRCAAHQASM